LDQGQNFQPQLKTRAVTPMPVDNLVETIDRGPNFDRLNITSGACDLLLERLEIGTFK
jgi:hypothetical protein